LRNFRPKKRQVCGIYHRTAESDFAGAPEQNDQVLQKRGRTYVYYGFPASL